jgi:Domain of unknown function (DUF4251)
VVFFITKTLTNKFFFMTTKYFTKAVILFAFTITGSCTLNAQDNAQDNDSLIQRRIRAQQFVFVPQSFSSSSIYMPITVRDYRLEVTYDSIIAILPYFGKSDKAQFGRADDDAGIRFTSKSFAYSAVAKKKGKWEITIEPKDASGVRVFLTIFKNGDAQMDVTSPLKESMLFKGYVW